MKRSIDGLGCSTNIVHNCVRSGCDTLPIEVEAMVVKIYAYFHVCIVLLNYTASVVKLILGTNLYCSMDTLIF
jgi:hypothetical protein